MNEIKISVESDSEEEATKISTLLAQAPRLKFHDFSAPNYVDGSYVFTFRVEERFIEDEEEQ